MPLKEVDWDNYEFHCHYFGELMTATSGKTNLDKYNEANSAKMNLFEKLGVMKDGAAKNNALIKFSELCNKVDTLKLTKDIPTLSKTCKKRLVQIYSEETTGRVKDIESMFIEKGLKVEEDAITLYSLRTGLYYRKNKQRLNNGFVTGEIDFDDEEKDTTIDTKASWDIFTFDATIASGINPIYWWQGQMYMWLKNRSRHRIAYCLVNTPEEMIKKLEYRMRNNFIGTQDEYDEACALLRDKHIYEDLPVERRIRVYEFERSDKHIELAKSYIPHFRNYLKNITNTKLEEDEQLNEETE